MDMMQPSQQARTKKGLCLLDRDTRFLLSCCKKHDTHPHRIVSYRVGFSTPARSILGVGPNIPGTPARLPNDGGARRPERVAKPSSSSMRA